MTTLLARLCAEARDAGFDDVGACPADVEQPYRAELEAAFATKRFDVFPWMTRTLDQRVHVRGRIPRAKSVVVVVLSYYQGDHEDVVDEAAIATGARVSRYAWGQDYHHIMRRKLRRLRKWLLAATQTTDPDAVVAPFNDVDAVTERAWAVACGLGFIGKSGMFISQSHGTWTFLGGLITSVDLWADQGHAVVPPRIADACGSCTRCLDACPSGAIIAPNVVDPERCLTTWNIESATDPRAEDFAGSGWGIGCDVCQEVCPWNSFATTTTEARFAPLHVMLDPRHPPNADTVAGTPLARPGVDVLQTLATRALAPRAAGLAPAASKPRQPPVRPKVPTSPLSRSQPPPQSQPKE